MKFSVAAALFLALIAAAHALPSSRMGRQEEAPAEEPAADAAPAEAAPAEAQGEKHHEHEHDHHHAHAHEHKPEHKPEHEHEHEHKPEYVPEVRPHPLNWHAILHAFKAVAPVVGGLVEPLLINIAHGVVGAIIETINSGFSIPTPAHHPEPYHHE